MELNTLLLDAQSKNLKKRQAAEAQIASLEKNYTSDYILQLAYELSNENACREVRQMAGISIKNLLLNSRKDPELKEAWSNCPHKQTVRDLILSSLGSKDRDVRKTAAQAVAAVAKHDLPTHSWEGLLSVLIQNTSNSNTCYKTASLITLGYICEGIGSGVLSKEQGDMILTGICASLAPQETDFSVRTVAMQALLNSLKFYKANFENEEERRYIMSLLIQNLEQRDMNIRIITLRALCEISSLYYSYLGAHLAEIAKITYDLIQHTTGETCILAIEVWSMLAEEEIIRKDTISSLNCISKAARSLTQILVEKLSAISKEENWSEWDEQKAAACCLNLIAQLCPDVFDIVELFVRKEIQSQNWAKRQASILALGSVIEWVPSDRARNTLILHISCIQNILRNDIDLLKENAAWCLAKICEGHWLVVIETKVKEVMIEEMLKGLSEKSKIGIHLCWGLSYIMEQSPKVFDYRDFDWIATSIVSSIDKHEFDELTHASLSLLNTTLEKIPDNSSQIIENISGPLISLFLHTISESTLSQPYADHMTILLASALQAAFAKIPAGFLNGSQAGVLITNILTLFNKKVCIVEEALQAIGAIAMNLEENFSPYLAEVMKFVTYALRQVNATSIVKSGVLCLGDFARSVGGEIVKYLEEVIPHLKKLLVDERMMLDIKLECLSTISDLAVASGGYFVQYLVEILQIVDQAAWISLQPSDDEETNSYLSLLREHILNFYVGIIQCLKDANSLPLLYNRISNLLDYLSRCLDLPKSLDLDDIAVGLIGDILMNFPDVAHIVSSATSSYLSSINTNLEGRTREVAKWTESFLSSLLINTKT
jgi:importin subunit beta-1